MIYLLLSLITSFLVTYFLVPRHIEKLKKLKMLEKDVNKEDYRKVPGFGGLTILAGFIIGIFVSLYFMKDMEAVKLLGAISAVLLFSLVGLVDDVLRLTRKKLFLTFFPALLLLAAGIVDPFISLPIKGVITIGILGWILIPVFVMATANFTNMLAGFNGLEAGTGAIMAFSLLICTLILGYPQAPMVALLLSSLLGALLGFLPYNKYPAKVFPGDTGTYLIGGVIGIAASIGDIKLLAVILLIPHILDATLKFLTGGILQENSYYPPEFLADGRLTIKKEAMREYNSLLRVILTKRPMGERSIVNLMLVVEGVLGLAVICISLIIRGII